MNPKNIFATFLFLLLSSIVYSQKFNSVDNIVLKYPKHFENPKELANQIQKNFTSEYDKSRAIFTWMALNISYDVKSWKNPKPITLISYKTQLEYDLKIQEIDNTTITTVFKKHLAVCDGYSLLFNHLATLVGLKSEVIYGMAKTTLEDVGRKKIRVDHAWNSVMIDGTWRLIDVTWAAGSVVNAQGLWVKMFNPIYFDTAPHYFFTKHFPASGVWLNQTIDEVNFLKAPLLYEKCFEEKYEILEPKSGIIEVVDNQKIVFKIRNLTQYDNLLWIGKSNVLTQINSIKNENSVLEFDIIYKQKNGKSITIYVNNTAIAAFKIVQKSKIEKL